MTRRTRFVLIAGGLFAALVLLEHVRSTEPFDIFVFATDMFEMALLAAAVSMTAFVSAEARDTRIERLELLDDLSRARHER